jgi:hypothetical protein
LASTGKVNGWKVIFDINDIASIGAVGDIPSYMIPSEAWTTALNMRYSDEAMEALDGWEQVFGTPLYAPHFLMPVVTPSIHYWLYTSLAKAVVYDGITHTDITRAVGGDYTTTDSWQWNGTMLGGIGIVNNGVDVPQYWATASPATKLANLPNWDVNTRAKVIRAFGPFLVAISITVGGTQFPHRVRWSHPADPGTVPISWDITDPTKDAGEVDFSDAQSGILLDALPLGPTMFIYKESSIWKMKFVGGQSIFDFGQSAWLNTAGLLSPRCVAISGDGMKHVLATQDDIIWHDGNTVRSILNKRQRKRLQNEIDGSNFGQSFMFANPFRNEMWFCYPRQGSTFPDVAIIMNYHEAGGQDFTVTTADGITFRNAATGGIEGTFVEIWDSGTDTWDVDTGPWSTLERRRVVLVNPTASKFYTLGHGSTRDGVVFTSTLARDGLALIGKKSSGGVIEDFQKMKMVKRIWPKILGGSVNIKFSAAQTVGGAVAFSAPVAFDPATMVYADPGPVSGRAVGLEITSTGNFRLDGYKIDVAPMGDF